MSDPAPLDNQQLQARLPDRVPPWPPPVQYAAATSSVVALALLGMGQSAIGLGFLAASIVLQVWALALSWGGGTNNSSRNSSQQ